MDGRLEGEVAVVTGSTGLGSGTQIARTFAQEGACVVVTGRNRERGQAIADGIRAHGGTAAFVAADVTVEKDCSDLIDAAVGAFGKLTVLVNSAVADPHLDGAVAALSTEVWEATLRADVTGPFWLCRTAIPYMISAGHGSIVNLGSRVAIRGTPNLAAYTASKGALHALTRSITIDYARKGVRCNTLAPGYIVGKERSPDFAPHLQDWINATHLTQPPTTAGVAALALYLASAESASVTGVEIPMDGGSSAVRGASLG